MDRFVIFTDTDSMHDPKGYSLADALAGRGEPDLALENPVIFIPSVEEEEEEEEQPALCIAWEPILNCRYDPHMIGQVRNEIERFLRPGGMYFLLLHKNSLDAVHQKQIELFDNNEIVSDKYHHDRYAPYLLFCAAIRDPTRQNIGLLRAWFDDVQAARANQAEGDLMRAMREWRHTLKGRFAQPRGTLARMNEGADESVRRQEYEALCHLPDDLVSRDIPSLVRLIEQCRSQVPSTFPTGQHLIDALDLASGQWKKTKFGLASNYSPEAEAEASRRLEPLIGNCAAIESAIDQLCRALGHASVAISLSGEKSRL